MRSRSKAPWASLSTQPVLRLNSTSSPTFSTMAPRSSTRSTSPAKSAQPMHELTSPMQPSQSSTMCSLPTVCPSPRAAQTSMYPASTSTWQSMQAPPESSDSPTPTLPCALPKTALLAHSATPMCSAQIWAMSSRSPAPCLPSSIQPTPIRPSISTARRYSSLLAPATTSEEQSPTPSSRLLG